MATIKIEPENIEVNVPKGLPLIKALWQAGLAVETPCGGFGICGKCRIRFTEGHIPEPNAEDLRHLLKFELQDGWRLICRHKVEGDSVIFIPEDSRPSIAQILTTAVERETNLKPAVKRFVVKVPEASTSDERSQVQRLLDSLKQNQNLTLPPSSIPLSVIRSLPNLFRLTREVCVTLHVDENNQTRFLSVEPAGEIARPPLGMAFDIGTTTLVGYLLNLETGEEIAHSARLNPQVQFGDDVVSRLCFAMSQPNGLRQLQQAVVRGMNEIIADCCQEASVKPTEIYELLCVGNTAMLHLLLGVSPEPIAFAPYVPVFNDSVTVEGWRLGLKVHPNGLVTTLPCVAGYIGSDTVAVVLAHLHEPDGEPVVALDIGTNGEIVVRNQGQYWCASAAAGPAFEGGRIYQGMRAERGAIAQVSVERSDNKAWLVVSTLGGSLPKGICGSGLIDAVAALLEIGILDESGRIKDNLPEWSERILSLNGQKVFQLVAPQLSERNEGIVLSQRDVRELQLAKGSIRAVTEVLLKVSNLSWKNVSKVIVAGAFGIFVNLESAKRIGLLPQLPKSQFAIVGNAAGAGAKLALKSVTERKRAAEIAKKMNHVPMTGNLDYQEALMEFIVFP
ncbi:MAG: ASKHA domain-containing protein [Armatimonadetes bacterium]|nr:ASKHA domain-containing protein [Armatimonadota bacterium]MDW8027668.1 ASKHA domain-containing protein [Armatimonadota bacterium]